MLEGYRLRARGVLRQLPLMGISVFGVFLTATLFFLMLSNPGRNTVWAIMTSGVMLGLIFLLSLRGLKVAAFRSIAVWRIGPDGLTACFMGMTRRAPWREVYDVRRFGSTLFVDMVNRTLELRIPADLADDEMGDIGEFWSRRRARGVPAVLQSYCGVGMWLVVSVIMLAFADLWLVMAFRPNAEAETLWTAAVLSTIALASLCRAMALVTEKIAIGPDHIERSTCFGHVMVPLREVRLLTPRAPVLRVESPRRRAGIEPKNLMLAPKEGVSLLVPPGSASSSEPRRTPGRICLASGKAHIRFNIRAYPFDLFMPELAEACCQAAILDDWTGEVYPPRNTDSVQTGREATAFCHRARRRYIALGLLQIVGLPGVFLIFSVTALMLGVRFINCAPFTLDTAIANFRKAANVKRTCAQFGDI